MLNTKRLVLQYCLLSSCATGIYFHDIQVTIVHKSLFSGCNCSSETLIFKQGG